MDNTDNNIIENMNILAEIRAKNPSATHVNVQRIKKGIDVGWVDIPIAQAEMTLRQNPAWRLLTSNKQMDDDIEKLFNDEGTSESADVSDTGHAHATSTSDTSSDIEVPPKPSEEAAAEQGGEPTTSTENDAAPSDVVSPPEPEPVPAPSKPAKKTVRKVAKKKAK